MLRNKSVGVVSASAGSFGAAWGQADLRKVLGRAGARVIEGDFAVPQSHLAFDENGRLRDADLAAGLLTAVQALVEGTRESMARAPGT